MPAKQREPLAGGSLSKLAGRAKEMAGSLRERRIAGGAERREVEADPVETAAEDRFEARATDGERQAQRAEEAADRLDPKEEH